MIRAMTREQAMVESRQAAALNTGDIVDAMARERGLEPWRVRGRARQREYVRARIEIAKRLREEGCSFPEIGRALRRDHSTVMYYLEAIRKPQAWKYMVHLSRRGARSICGVPAGDGIRTREAEDVTCPTCKAVVESAHG